MPELVSNGPRIPVHLMNEVDTGGVVFFCGAGISTGDGSELPSFAELVDHVYEANRMGKDEDEVEREALHLDEPDPGLRKPQLDKALGACAVGKLATICSSIRSFVTTTYGV